MLPDVLVGPTSSINSLPSPSTAESITVSGIIVQVKVAGVGSLIGGSSSSINLTLKVWVPGQGYQGHSSCIPLSQGLKWLHHLMNIQIHQPQRVVHLLLLEIQK